jgi:hypothetical protein
MYFTELDKCYTELYNIDTVDKISLVRSGMAFCEVPERSLEEETLERTFGGTWKIFYSQLARSFAEGEILNPCSDSFVGFTKKGE